MRIKWSDILLAVLALLAVIVANNDVSVVRSKGTEGAYSSPSPYPYVVSILRSYPSPTDDATVEFKVTFSEPVTGVDVSDFSLITTGLTGTSILAPYSLDYFNYTVGIVTGSGAYGTIRLDLDDDDSILSFSSIPLGGVGADNGSYSNGQTYVIDRSAPPANDKFSSAETITTLSFSAGAYTYGATVDESDPVVGSCGVDRGLATVWYKYTPTADTAISVDTFGADYDTFIAVWTKPADVLEFVACNNDTKGTKQSALALQVKGGTTYYIEIGQP